MTTPSKGKQLAAQVRAAREKLEAKYRRPCKEFKGSFEIHITREEVYARLGKQFGIPPNEIDRYFTFSRSCTHPWSAGACKDCPSVDHLFMP